MKSKLAKIFIIIGALILFVGIIFIIQENFKSNREEETPGDLPGDTPVEDFENKDIEELQPKDETQDEIRKLTEGIFEENVDKNKLEKLIGEKISNDMIFYGKDSYFRTKIKDSLLDDEYIRKRNEYASSIEKTIKENFKFEIKDYIVSEDGAIVQRISYRTYYYNVFLDDYNKVTNRLIDYSGLDVDKIQDGSATEEEQKKLHKIYVKALELMEKNKNYYINESETLDRDVIYKKGDKEVSNNYLSLYIGIMGTFYSNEKISSDKTEERVNNIIQNAISSGQLDINNPYELN